MVLISNRVHICVSSMPIRDKMVLIFSGLFITIYAGLECTLSLLKLFESKIGPLQLCDFLLLFFDQLICTILDWNIRFSFSLPLYHYFFWDFAYFHTRNIRFMSPRNVLLVLFVFFLFTQMASNQVRLRMSLLNFLSLLQRGVTFAFKLLDWRGFLFAKWGDLFFIWPVSSLIQSTSLNFLLLVDDNIFLFLNFGPVYFMEVFLITIFLFKIIFLGLFVDLCSLLILILQRHVKLKIHFALIICSIKKWMALLTKWQLDFVVSVGAHLLKCCQSLEQLFCWDAICKLMRTW